MTTAYTPTPLFDSLEALGNLTHKALELPATAQALSPIDILTLSSEKDMLLARKNSLKKTNNR